MPQYPFVLPSVFRAERSPEFFQTIPLIVESEPTLNANMLAGKVAIRLNGDIGKTIDSMNMFSLIIPTGMIDDLAAIDGVKSISLDRRHYAFAPTLPLAPPIIKSTIDGFVPTSETLKKINIPALHAAGITGKNIKVAVLDTGIDLANPQIQGAAVKMSSMKLFPTGDDDNGHGSWCNSCIKGRRFVDTVTGLVAQGGAPDCNLTSIKVLGYGIGTGMTSDIMEAMELAVNQGNKVISMSLGSEGSDDEDSDPMVRMINQYAVDYPDVMFVIAAGNSGPGPQTIGIPGCAEKALTVGSLGVIDNLPAYFSSRGPTRQSALPKPCIMGCGGGRAVDTFRPKENIWSGTSMGSLLDGMDKVVNGFTAIAGTSMATPQVAAVMACWKQQYPELTSDIAKGIFKVMGKPHDMTSGYGLIDALWIENITTK